MRRTLLYAVVIATLTWPAGSVAGELSGKGVKGGVLLSGLCGAPTNCNLGPDTNEEKPQAGPYFGSFITYSFAALAIQTELIVSRKGNLARRESSGAEGTIQIWYLAVPVVARLGSRKPGVHPTAHFGLYVGYGFQFDYESEIDPLDEADVDIGVALGLGFDIRTRHGAVQVDARVERGFFPVFEEGGNFALIATVGYAFAD